MILNDKTPHGGDIYTNKVLLDFSANVNPFGMPEKVRLAAEAAAGQSFVYPDPYCGKLREKLSNKERVPADNILCGNGAAELIYSFAYTLAKDKPALIVSPTFGEYRTALNAAGVKTEDHIINEQNGFELDDGLLEKEMTQYGALFICTPNNPTGKNVRPDLLLKIAETGVRMFVDMCFLDMTDSPEMYDTQELLRTHRNVLILKAFTKSFAIPGLRLGYAMCCDNELLNNMAGKAPCWNVSLPAQEAGCAALDCMEWLDKTVKTVSKERKRLAGELSSIGIKVFPGEADFLLLYSEKDLCSRLLEYGILVRDCSDFTGLKKGFLRIAVRRPEENDRLLSAIKDIIDQDHA